ncbi:hypothetical protein FHS43_000589 [Streptosporangium becharense]|uniref:Uncharacterized protein n=1 Tax=Streptosporangium becharense TaxID=1816182 RepID=A0A7W9MKP2_9ACTN|nr:hypothetical protein [Streptosporangium becharense]MBB2909343.1 hypothetical protein [Streptosporangium becharense]MBB5823754.1 hypothetical protein [Streptosporangium becharense]
MTPEDLDRLHQAALRRGVDPDELDRLRTAALADVGGDMEQLARQVRIHNALAAFKNEIRHDPPLRP